MQDIFAKGLVPAGAVARVEDAVPLAEAVLAGGLNVLEITFRTDAAAAAIRAITKALPDMRVGAGTVLSADQVERAAEAGICFGVAPGSTESVVRKAQELKIPFAPGVTTPSEVERALGWGCTALKFFPAEAMGGVKTLKSLAGPYKHTGVAFLPTGGISAANMADYLALPVVQAVGGSWPVAKDLVAACNWEEITRLTAEAVAIAAKALAD
jgi:2-dehydro-3-deoxyphosphogluconate aldolase/(4S)-4-hydroxy-2-oxoglutarate aldolase